MELLEIVRNLAIAIGILLALAGVAGLLPTLWPWRRWSKTGMLLAVGAQTTIGAVTLARKQSAPSAFVIPLAGTLLLAAWLLDPKVPFLAYSGPLIDLGIVLWLSVCAFRTYRRGDGSFEDVFRQLLGRWFPGKGSALFALAALDVGGFRYIAGGWRRPPPRGLSYHRNNATLALVALVAVSALPELFVVELFLTGKSLLWHAIDVGAHVYAIFWLAAIFVSFRNRPHTFENDALVLRRGVFETIRVPLSAIEHLEPARRLTRPQRRLLSGDTAYLGLFDSPLLELSLHWNCELQRAAGRSKMVKKIYMAVDDERSAIAEIRLRLPPPDDGHVRANAAAE